MGAPKNTIDTFLSPAGFIEQRYIGSHKAPSVAAAVKELDRLAKQVQKSKKPVLVLIDVTKAATTINPETNKITIDAMRTIKYTRGAVYGSLATVVLVNTLGIVAGKRHKVQGFTDRAEAIKWLRGGKT